MANPKILAQSAMEYLMTYGWSILIIAVVLGALFQLGVFNSVNFAPRAPPGSCKVTKLGGNFNLLGVCNGQLPQYAAQLGNPGGIHKYISIPSQSSYSGLPLTVSIWVFGIYDSLSAEHPMISKNGEWLMTTNEAQQGSANFGVWLKYCSNVGGSCNSWESYSNPGSTINFNQWYNVVAVYANTGMTLYVNGVQAANAPQSITTAAATANPILIANLGGGYTSFSGNMENVQIYNVSLSANDIQALYIAGIGGAPLYLRNLVGWWPLNGDFNDYSSNYNNAAPANVPFISSWMNGYVPP